MQNPPSGVAVDDAHGESGEKGWETSVDIDGFVARDQTSSVVSKDIHVTAESCVWKSTYLPARTAIAYHLTVNELTIHNNNVASGDCGYAAFLQAINERKLISCFASNFVRFEVLFYFLPNSACYSSLNSFSSPHFPFSFTPIHLQTCRDLREHLLEFVKKIMFESFTVLNDNASTLLFGCISSQI